MESKVRESTKSRKRLYIGINQRPSRFTPSGEMTSGGMGADEMRDSAALLGQLKCRTVSSSDAEDPAAPSSSNYPISHDYAAPSAYPAHKYPTYFHPGFAHPVSSFSNSDVHDHYSSSFSLPVPGFGHMPPYSRFHEKYLPYSLQPRTQIRCTWPRLPHTWRISRPRVSLRHEALKRTKRVASKARTCHPAVSPMVPIDLILQRRRRSQ